MELVERSILYIDIYVTKTVNYFFFCDSAERYRWDMLLDNGVPLFRKTHVPFQGR